VTVTVAEAALAWHDAGGCVLPVAGDGSKRPGLPTWNRYQQQRPSREQVATWASASPGIGMVCGAVSGGIEMLELEGAAVTAGIHMQLRALLEQSGHADLWAKLQTYVEVTPKGGIHWLFRIDGAPVPGNTKLAKRPRTPTDDDPSTVETLIETRGEGGFTILAPSNGATHPTGKPWQLVVGRPGEVPVLTVDEVETLHRLARSFDEMPDMPPVVDPRPVDRRPGELTPGDDYNRRTDWADILVPAGWTLVGARGDTHYWRRPGKNIGVSATTGYGDQGHDLLYVFTTSTLFEAQRSYSKLAAYATLHHGGDFSAAARSLRARGYGTPPERENPLTLIHGGATVTDAMTKLPASAAGEDLADSASWGRIDLTAHLDGTHVPQVPELLGRADGEQLLYRGRVHSFHGESESGKSWVALAAAAEALQDGQDVLMLDFESDAHTVVGRLLRLGVYRTAIADHFDYRRPELSPAGLAREFEAWTALLGARYTIAILDGVTEALAVYGVTSKDNDEVTGWIRSTPRKIAQATGAAVILVDHVTKDADSRGRFAIGGQAKMAALDGAAYVVEVLEPLGVGLVGRVALRVAKDRPGGVRPHAGAWRKSDRTQEAAVVVIDSTDDDSTTVRVEAPRSDTLDTPPDERRPFQPTGLMEKVSAFLENAGAAVSRNGIASAIPGRREYVMQAIDALVDGGWAVADGPALRGGRPSIRSARPYRQSDPADLIDTPSTDPFPTRSQPFPGNGSRGGDDPFPRSPGVNPGTGTGRLGQSGTPQNDTKIGNGSEHIDFHTGEVLP
jgi:hypothetical protein